MANGGLEPNLFYKSQYDCDHLIYYGSLTLIYLVL